MARNTKTKDFKTNIHFITDEFDHPLNDIMHYLWGYDTLLGEKNVHIQDADTYPDGKAEANRRMILLDTLAIDAWWEREADDCVQFYKMREISEKEGVKGFTIMHYDECVYLFRGTPKQLLTKLRKEHPELRKFIQNYANSFHNQL